MVLLKLNNSLAAHCDCGEVEFECDPRSWNGQERRSVWRCKSCGKCYRIEIDLSVEDPKIGVVHIAVPPLPKLRNRREQL